MTEAPTMEAVQTPGLDGDAVERVLTETLSAEALALAPHPYVPLPTREEWDELMSTPDGAAKLTELLNKRGRLLYLMEVDPLRYGVELDQWKDADALLDLITILIVFGGNRAGKSEWAAKRVVETITQCPGTILIALHETAEGSIGTQQKLIWKYLPPELKALNGKHHPVYKIRYSQAGGFTEGKLVLPNASELIFAAYKQDPGIYEGWELGVKGYEALMRKLKADPRDAGATRLPKNIGAWGDENMTLPWLRMLMFRVASRAAKILWTFTPVNGMTQTIKDAVGTAPRTLESRPAELLSDRVNVPGLPKGHMPYIQVPYIEAARVIYFFSIWNKFGASYEQIKKICVGRPSEFVERRAYGYARDTGARAFPIFGPWNIVPVESLPAIGTNYMATDPAGARNWATLWVRVTPGKNPDLYFYRDWPDYARFGEWAVTAASPLKFDGDEGPAQPSIGYGVEEYKKLFLREESVKVVVRDGKILERDPYRRAMVEKWLAENIEQPTSNNQHRLEMTDGQVLQEAIKERYIDPRAGRNQTTAENAKVGRCLIDKLQEIQRNPKGEIIGPSMTFWPAAGIDIIDGVNQINSLLYFDKNEELIPLMNAPRIYVAESCKNLIWAFQNWTGKDGEKGASKDFIDLVRYLVTADLRHIEPGGVIKTRGGGSY